MEKIKHRGDLAGEFNGKTIYLWPVGGRKNPKIFLMYDPNGGTLKGQFFKADSPLTYYTVDEWEREFGND